MVLRSLRHGNFSLESVCLWRPPHDGKYISCRNIFEKNPKDINEAKVLVFQLRNITQKIQTKQTSGLFFLYSFRKILENLHKKYKRTIRSGRPNLRFGTCGGLTKNTKKYETNTRAGQTARTVPVLVISFQTKKHKFLIGAFTRLLRVEAETKFIVSLFSLLY